VWKRRGIALDERNTEPIETIWGASAHLKDAVKLFMLVIFLQQSIWKNWFAPIFLNGGTLFTVRQQFPNQVNVLPEKGVAFVMYKSILNAEFAKEAMKEQTLETDDVSQKFSLIL
jgi:hypothetical protein